MTYMLRGTMYSATSAFDDRIEIDLRRRDAENPSVPSRASPGTGISLDDMEPGFGAVGKVN